jgi:hypothetical protein
MAVLLRGVCVALLEVQGSGSPHCLKLQSLLCKRHE